MDSFTFKVLSISMSFSTIFHISPISINAHFSNKNYQLIYKNHQICTKNYPKIIISNPHLSPCSYPASSLPPSESPTPPSSSTLLPFSFAHTSRSVVLRIRTHLQLVSHACILLAGTARTLQAALFTL